jgi:2-oxoglutarate dehydrogenase E1 component
LDPLGLTATVEAPEIANARARISSTTIDLSFAGRKLSVAGERAVDILRSVYSGHAALEAQHIGDSVDRAWIYETYEKELLSEADDRVLSHALESVLLADEFERFIRTKWPSKKRSGVEGSESSLSS